MPEVQSFSSNAENVRFIDKFSLDGDHLDTVQHFCQLFREKTGTEADYVIRSPGRVNLIGDHIDYHGFAVLPIAIDNCIWLGISLAQATNQEAADGDGARGYIKIFNKDERTYPTLICEHSLAHGSALVKSHKWYNYILCGYHGVIANSLLQIPLSRILEHANTISDDNIEMALANQVRLPRLKSINLLVDSNLPPASGLSSSSALVCASALATRLLLHESFRDDSNQELNINSREMANCCSVFEHLIGTHGGGMDQAVIMTAQTGYAKYIEFVPQLNCHNIMLPDNIVWIVSHCGVNYPKADTCGFNARVLETKLAAAMIAHSHALGRRIQLDCSISLGRIKRDLFGGLMSAYDIISYIREKVFSKDEYSIDEICLKLGLSRGRLIDQFGTSEQFLTDNLKNHVKLLSRCEHVFLEAERVEKFRSICDSNKDVKILGELMTQSHQSLRDKYECSHPSLDKLVEVAIGAGALGARLTGAGWGGCIVALVESKKSDQVQDQLARFSPFTSRTAPQSGCDVIKV